MQAQICVNEINYLSLKKKDPSVIVCLFRTCQGTFSKPLLFRGLPKIRTRTSTACISLYPRTFSSSQNRFGRHLGFV